MKTLTAACLSLAAILGAASSQAQAFCGLRGCFKKHCYKYSIHCRPYNAFTPICYGNLYCDGCCPAPCGLPPAPVCPNWGPAPCCMAGAPGSDCGCLGELPAPMHGHEHSPYPGNGPVLNYSTPGASTYPPASEPTFMAPPPTPLDGAQPMPMEQSRAPRGGLPIHPAAYRAPGAMPAYPMPMPPAYNPYYHGYYPPYNPYWQGAPAGHYIPVSVPAYNPAMPGMGY